MTPFVIHVVIISTRREFIVESSTRRMGRMKKLMSLMLGLAFIGSTVTVVFADDAATSKTVEKKTSKAKKTVEKKTVEKKTAETK
jgi:hypothetical protein